MALIDLCKTETASNSIGHTMKPLLCNFDEQAPHKRRHDSSVM